MSLLFLEFESFINGWMWIGKKIDSVILSVTCHGLRNSIPCRSVFDLLDQIPCSIQQFNIFISICNIFYDPMSYPALSMTHLWPHPCYPLNCMMEVTGWWDFHGLGNSYTSHLYPFAEFPLISICEFLEPYELLFFEFEPVINGWMQIGIILTQ